MLCSFALLGCIYGQWEALQVARGHSLAEQTQKPVVGRPRGYILPLLSFGPSARQGRNMMDQIEPRHPISKQQNT